MWILIAGAVVFLLFFLCKCLVSCKTDYDREQSDKEQERFLEKYRKERDY